jgi:hypothetical protein
MTARLPPVVLHMPGLLHQSRVEGVADAVAQEIAAEGGREMATPGTTATRGTRHDAGRLVQDGVPARRRREHSDPEEREPRLDDHHVKGSEGAAKKTRYDGHSPPVSADHNASQEARDPDMSNPALGEGIRA